MKNKVLILDIETNGFLDVTDTCWMLVAQEVGGTESFVFSDYAEGARPLEEAEEFVKGYAAIAGHNLYGFDIPAIKKLMGWEPDWDKQKVYDTLIMSWLVDFKQPGGHSLGRWGEAFKYPKGDFKEFDKYSQEMLDYCIQDVSLNEKLFRHLSGKCKEIIEKKPLFKEGLRVEHKWAYYEMRMRQVGWKFNEHQAHITHRKWVDRMEEIRSKLEPRLKTRCVNKGELVPKLKKDGGYYVTTLKWFGEQADYVSEHKSFWGPMTKVEFVEPVLNQLDNVKEHLFSLGWQPDDWNVKKEQGKWVQTGPKITDTSLEALDKKLEAEGHPEAGFGAALSEYNTLKSRRGVPEGWLKVTKNGRLYPRTWTIGTPTFRCRHEVITNLPGVNALGGKELRSLLTSEDGYKVVGADSAGNQFRALAYYMNDADFTKSVISGSSADGSDVHSRNAKIIGCTRNQAKPFIYALLFGAGDEKLGLILTGKKDKEPGRKARLKLMKGLPGLKALKEKVDNMFFGTQNNYGRGFIPGLDGRLSYPNSGHQALNYLLQTFEAITCKAALVYAFDKMTEEGLDFYPTLFYHDEIAVVVKEEQAQRALDISIEAMIEGPKWFNVDIMDGDGCIGDTYADVH